MDIFAPLAGAVIAIVSAPVALGALGFGAAGPVAGTIAAQTMSVIGTVSAGGAFATLQSAGMAGMGMAGKMVVGAAGAFIGRAAENITAPYV